MYTAGICCGVVVNSYFVSGIEAGKSWILVARESFLETLFTTVNRIWQSMVAVGGFYFLIILFIPTSNTDCYLILIHHKHFHFLVDCLAIWRILLLIVFPLRLTLIVISYS